MGALHVTKANFESEVLKSDVPVLVDFWAAWCGPCQILLPVIEELAEEATNAKICKVNVDEEPELAQEYGVMSIPTLLIVKDGKVAHTVVGAKPKSEILELLFA